MKNLRVGVIGLGWVAQVFHLPILAKLEDVELVAVCDKDKPRSRSIAEKFSAPYLTTDPQHLIDRDDIDAVLVCTSTDAHHPVVSAALKGGKDVFVEKPITRTYAEAKDLTELANREKRKLMVGMNNRFRPDTMILKSFVEKGELGKLFYAKGGWLKSLSDTNPWITRKEKSGGGVLLDLGIVIIDLVLWMMDFPPVQRVSASVYSHKTKSVEDTCLATITMKPDCVLMLEVSWSLLATQDYFYCNLFGTEGSALINPLRIHKQLHGNLVNLTPASSESPNVMYRKSYENQLRHFTGALRGLHPVISTGEEAMERMKVVEAIYRSSRKGKEIELA
ncbi:MAG TPA: Gfo/Idh/MocA family oxidoreductase [Bacteroidota bacterium]|nr:Gfo/Idh/MocA family oxidoreductase [Bacteroidota bacterium]